MLRKYFEKRKQTKIVQEVNKFDETFSKMSDDELKRKSLELKQRAKDGESLDKIMPEAFALAKEASWRVLRKKHYDVQVIGGSVLHSGNIAEMSTGSGKSHPVWTKIPTPNGFKSVGDIKEGDFLFDAYGRPTKVLAVHPQGVLDDYEVVLSDGRKVPASESHLWDIYVKNGDDLELQVVETKDLLDKKVTIPMTESVQFNAKNKNKVSSYNFAKALLNKRSEVSYIPNQYKYTSSKERRELLQGFIDASLDMYPPIEGKHFSLKIGVFSVKLCADILEVIYSLGYSATFKTTNSGGRERYLISFSQKDGSLKPIMTNKLLKKAGISEIDKYKPEYIFIKSVNKLNTKSEHVCFEVDNEEQLYLVGDYVVTHNTITALLPAYLNALTGKGVHIITVNDYLARRDMEENGKVLRFLGMTTSHIHADMTTEEKQYAYKCDVVYGTNSEFGFDYLRDNMVLNNLKKVQRDLNFCIIDEVDSILIDEARTPLIISSKGGFASNTYDLANRIAKVLVRGEDEKDLTKADKMELESRELTPEEIEAKKDFQVNEKYQTIILTDRGVLKIEEQFGITNLGDTSNALLYHHIMQAIRANHLMTKNVDYIVKNGEVLIVDKSTGRVMDGRRFSDGLHQALEAKEGVAVQSENVTSATITLQNYFRLYDKISGMTGTAKTEEREFQDIYGMNVVQVPDHKTKIRVDYPDVVYKSHDAKFNAVMKKAKEASKSKRPVLIGTASIAESEALSKLFKKNHIKHEVLNAKSTNNQDYSEALAEALIIAQAGTPGKITIATNMAGRGTDILLGGNYEHMAKAAMIDAGFSEEMIELASDFLNTEDEEVKAAQNKYQYFLEFNKKKCERQKEEVLAAGGLMVIGTEKHESRRIDNQLRGRAGRQGDPGSSVFIISLEDKLFQVYGGPMVQKMAMSTEETGKPLSEGGILGKAINTAQKNIETQNFEQRKDVLEYDEIDNVQRHEVYTLRNKLLAGDNVEKEFERFLEYGLNSEFINPHNVENTHLFQDLKDEDWFILNPLEFLRHKKDELMKQIGELNLSDEDMNELRIKVLLTSLDTCWKSHIITLQNLKEQARMVGMGNTQPIDYYKDTAMEAFDMFKERVGIESLNLLLTLKLVLN